MPSLAETQSALRDAIVVSDTAAIAPLLTGGRDPSYRLSVHQRHYQASLVDLLEKRFPALEWLVGAPFFKATAAAYIRRSPPRRPALGAYGQDFPAFLTAQPAALSMPWLSEVGALEWALAEVAAAVELPAIGLDAFAAYADASLETLTLALQPGLAYLACDWPVDELVKLHLDGNAPNRIAFEPRPTSLELRGARGAFAIRGLDPASSKFRGTLAQRQSLAAALGAAGEADAAFDPGVALAALFDEGLVTGIAAANPRDT